MIKKITTLLCTIAYCLTISFSINSQIAIANLDQLAKLKSGTTYIVMDNLDSDISKEYMEVYKKYWTITKIEFIKNSEIYSHISPNNSFFSINGLSKTTQFSSGNIGSATTKAGISYENTHIYLNLWMCNDKYFKKKDPTIGLYDQTQIARIELFTDFKTILTPELLFNSDYDGGGHINNWGVGFLKNYIQALMNFLNEGENRTLYSGITNVNELKNLKNQVLYVPDYILTKFNKFTGDESKRFEEDKILKDYTYKYQLISTKDLNQKIMEDTTPFYYLIYVKSSTDKFVSVVNSQTGEIIYSKYSAISYNIKSDDLKNIQKLIE
ncbi:MAG: hypothetical protein M9897_01815 [Brumimicrobium sp.]|nr:hypothetical protein [Brumimicrobium sp.]